MNIVIRSQEPDIPKRTLRMTLAAEKSHICRPRDLPNLTGLSRTTIWRLEKAGDFPNRIRLSAGAVGYRMTDIQAWLDSRQTVVEG